MNKAAVFFDLDGTICDIKKGMPDDTINAIHRLRENGHKAFLCTGRSRAYLPKELSALNLDGMVAACGAYLEYQGHCIYNERMSAPVARKTVEILRANGLVPVMEGWDYLYYDKEEYHNGIDWYADLITEQLGSRWRPIRNYENIMEINKVSAKRTDGCDYEKALQELSGDYDFINHGEHGFASNTIEMVPRGVSKATGIERMIRTLGIAWENTVAFGDSNNDIPMFEYVHTKVAMGNASQPLKNMADYITDDMWKGGIANGLRHFQLI